MTRMTLRALTVAALAAGSATASDPCPTGCNKSGHAGLHREKDPKPTCDSRIYPKSEGLYIRQFCGPHVNPNACFGYYPNQWRQWEVACGTPVPVPVTVAAPAGEKKDPAVVPATPVIPMPDKKNLRDQSPVSMPGSMLIGADAVPTTRLK